MSLLVVGSVAYDSIKTPRGEAVDALGGSAVYFALAARRFTPVRLVGVVGDDFAEADAEFLGQRNIDTAGLERVAGGKTFRWSGEYSADMNSRETLSVELNVFENFEPKIPAAFSDSRFVFLANGSPVTQMSVLDQMTGPRFVMADTMDLWIQIQRAELLTLLERIDGLLLNDSEALLLTDAPNVMAAGKALLDVGPERVVIKKGEHGAILFTGDHIIPLPAYPVVQVCDPTGAGDTFAGALMGHLQKVGSADERSFKEAMAYGTVVASYTVEEFGVGRIGDVSEGDLTDRYRQFRDLIAL